MAMSLQELQAQLSGLDGYTRKTDEELRAQAEGLYKSQYDQNLKMLTDSINQSVADQNRSALGSGMQRSSYNQAAQASILNQGVESRQKLAADYETNVANALYQLMAKEDEKELQANQQKNQLLMALYEYGQAAKKRSSGTTPPPDNEPEDENPEDIIKKLFGAISKSQPLWGVEFAKMKKSTATNPIEKVKSAPNLSFYVASNKK